MSMSIENTYLTNYSVDANTSAADKLSNQIQSADTDEETLEACKQFEAYMIEQMYKNMQEAAKILTDDGDEDSSNEYVDMFQDNYLQSIAESMVNSGQGLGIAEQLYESIQKNSGAATAADTSAMAAETGVTSTEAEG